MAEESQMIPTVFMFQPMGYRPVTTPDELTQWEDDMRDKVGLQIELQSDGGTPTETKSGKHGDSDYVNFGEAETVESLPEEFQPIPSVFMHHGNSIDVPLPPEETDGISLLRDGGCTGTDAGGGDCDK